MESAVPEFPRRAEKQPHELLEEQGFEPAISYPFADEDSARRALDDFKKGTPGQPNFSKVYDPKRFKVVPCLKGFVIYGFKTVHSAFERGRRKTG